MDVTKLGIVIELNLEHDEKAYVPMVLTVVGIEIEVMLEHCSNA